MTCVDGWHCRLTRRFTSTEVTPGLGSRYVTWTVDLYTKQNLVHSNVFTVMMHILFKYIDVGVHSY